MANQWIKSHITGKAKEQWKQIFNVSSDCFPTVVKDFLKLVSWSWGRCKVQSFRNAWMWGLAKTSTPNALTVERPHRDLIKGASAKREVYQHKTNDLKDYWIVNNQNTPWIHPCWVGKNLKTIIHLRTIRKHSVTRIFCTSSQKPSKTIQKYVQSKIKTKYYLVEGHSFKLRGREFL